MSASLEVKCSLNKDYVKVGAEDQVVYLVADVTPRSREANTPALPLNLSLVLDKSGSMEVEQKIGNVREAAKYILDHMGPQDYTSVVVFSDDAEVLVPAARGGETSGAAKKKLDQLRADGTTFLSAGMRLGLKEIDKHLGTDTINKVLLLTDGETNFPNDEQTCLQVAQEGKSRGVDWPCVGVGEDWNEDLLDRISDKNWKWIKSADEIIPFFEEQLKELQATLIRQATVRIKPSANVAIDGLWKARPQVIRIQDVSKGEVILTELRRDETQSVVFALRTRPERAGTFRIAQLEVVYALPNEPEQSVAADVVVTYTDNEGLLAAINPDVMQLLERVFAAIQIEKGEEMIAQGRTREGTQVLRRATQRLGEMGEDELAADVSAVVNKAERGQLKGDKTATKRMRAGTRRLTQKVD
jgi:Ca-activated chloride channel family protein